MKQSLGIKVFVIATVVLAGLGFLVFTQTNQQAVRAADDTESSFANTLAFPDGPEMMRTTAESTVSLSDQSTTVATSSRTRSSQTIDIPIETDVQAQRPVPAETEKNEAATKTSDQLTESPSKLAEPLTSSSGVGPIETEIFRLTNAYRANPTGPLARPEALPFCGKDSNKKQITIAHIQALQPLKLDVPVSLTMSRVWSKEMSDSSNASESLKANLRHSEDAWRTKLYKDLGIFGPSVRSYGHGENILVFSNYRYSVSSTEELAKKMFEGWRDSDGHFCNIVNESYTHLGVGHYYDKAGQFDWATQNFHFAK